MGQCCCNVAVVSDGGNSGSDNQQTESNSNGTGYSGSHRLDRRRLLEGRRGAASLAQQQGLSTAHWLRNVEARLLAALGSSEDSSFICDRRHPTLKIVVLEEYEILELCRVLCDVFRNFFLAIDSTSPTEYDGNRSDLENVALSCCRLMASKPYLFATWLKLGYDGCNNNVKSDSSATSVMSCLEDLAQQASLMINHHEKYWLFENDLQRCQDIMEVKTLVASAVAETDSCYIESTNDEHECVTGNIVIASNMTQSTSIDNSDSSTVETHRKCNPDESNDRCTHYRQVLGPLRFGLVDGPLSNYSFVQYNNVALSALALSFVSVRRLFKELSTYQTALPVEYGSSIFVRAVEGRLDQLRVLIIGPADTPYANGCFFFDVFLPPSYPNDPPWVRFITTGGGVARFNPNLYKCGKVCLSLLGTWIFGPGWVPGESTLLQVLVSIQSLILVPDPYFNEPGFQALRGTARGQARSHAYNLSIRQLTVRHAIFRYLQQIVDPTNSTERPMRNNGDDNTRTSDGTAKVGCINTITCEYPEFAQILVHHFSEKKASLLKQLTEWMPNLRESVEEKQKLLKSINALP